MEAIKVSKVLTQRIAELPELDRIIGADVEIIVLVKMPARGKTGPKAGAGAGRIQLRPGWDDPIDDFKDYT